MNTNFQSIDNLQGNVHQVPILVNLCLVCSQICSPTNKEEYKHNELSQILTSCNPHSLKFTPMSCTKQQMIIYNGKTLHIVFILFFLLNVPWYFFRFGINYIRKIKVLSC
jgi:hypothetical protein